MTEQGFSFQVRDHLTEVCKEKGITLMHQHQGEKFHQLLDLITFSSLGNLSDAVEYLLASNRLADSLDLYWIHDCDSIMEDLIFQLWKKVFIHIKYKLNCNTLKVSSITILRGIEEMITFVHVNHGNEQEVKNYLKMARGWFLSEGRRYHEKLMEQDPPEIEHLDVYQSKCAFCGCNAKDDRRLKIHWKKCERYQYFKKKNIVTI